MACRYHTHCCYGCGWTRIYGSEEEMFEAERAHYRDGCEQPTDPDDCKHKNTQTFCGKLGCLDCNTWLD